MSRQIKVWYYVKLLIFLKASIKSKFETILNYHFFFKKKNKVLDIRKIGVEHILTWEFYFILLYFK